MRIVLNTFGSLGDLHPYLALALELKKRGHDPLLATAEIYRTKIEALGLPFAAVRPNVGDLLSRPDLVEKLWHPRTGPDFLIKQYLLPVLEQSFEDLREACRGADFFIAHTAGYAGPVVAEMMKLPWLSVALQPMVLFSAYDPPVFVGTPFLNRLYRAFGGVGRLGLRLAKSTVASWAKPIQDLRTRVGLPLSRSNPLLEGQFSPHGTLALFSRHFSAPQRDWPPHTHETGFAFYDELGALAPDLASVAADLQGLERFLDAGPPPVLFTLGSSAVIHPGSFYEQSLAAAEGFGFRAVLLAGPFFPQRFSQALPPNVHVASYVPYSLVMPRCAAVVHQGGIGTTAQALRAGKPMVVVPWSYDQPDNAERARKLGVSETVPRFRYSAERIGRTLHRLLNERPEYRVRASAICELVARENGADIACGLIEDMPQRRS